MNELFINFLLKIINVSDEEYQAFVAARGSHQLPVTFLKLDVDIEKLIAGLGSNHIMAVDGQYADELVHLCEMLDIEPVFFN